MSRQVTLEAFGAEASTSVDTVNVTLYISEYAEMQNQTQELKTTFDITVNEDGQYVVSVSDRTDQEGAAERYYANLSGKGEIGTFDDYEEAKDAMRDVFYEFFSSGKTQMGPQEFGRTVESKTTGTTTDPSEDDDARDQREKLRDTLQEFRQELSQRKGFYTQQINQARDDITELENELDRVQEEVGELRERKKNLNRRAREAFEAGNESEAYSLWGKAGNIDSQNLSQELGAEITNIKREIKDEQQDIQEFKSRRSQIDTKIDEVRGRLDDL